MRKKVNESAFVVDVIKNKKNENVIDMVIIWENLFIYHLEVPINKIMKYCVYTEGLGK